MVLFICWPWVMWLPCSIFRWSNRDSLIPLQVPNSPGSPKKNNTNSEILFVTIILSGPPNPYWPPNTILTNWLKPKDQLFLFHFENIINFCMEELSFSFPSGFGEFPDNQREGSAEGWVNEIQSSKVWRMSITPCYYIITSTTVIIQYNKSQN